LCGEISGLRTFWPDFASVLGAAQSAIYSVRELRTSKLCPYCEGCSGDADGSRSLAAGLFLASNFRSSLIRRGRKLGTIHVLKDITERKRAEEKYRNLVAKCSGGRVHLHAAGALPGLQRLP